MANRRSLGSQRLLHSLDCQSLASLGPAAFASKLLFVSAVEVSACCFKGGYGLTLCLGSTKHLIFFKHATAVRCRRRHLANAPETGIGDFCVCVLNVRQPGQGLQMRDAEIGDVRIV